MKTLTQLTSPWDHGVSMTYQAFEIDDLEDATKYSIQFNGQKLIGGWLRVYRKEKFRFYLLLS